MNFLVYYFNYMSFFLNHGISLSIYFTSSYDRFLFPCFLRSQKTRIKKNGSTLEILIESGCAASGHADRKCTRKSLIAFPISSGFCCDSLLFERSIFPPQILPIFFLIRKKNSTIYRGNGRRLRSQSRATFFQPTGSPS